jgi:hypothetical protein
MKSQSELLTAMVKKARKAGLRVVETKTSFDFYDDLILVERFKKFNVDYTCSEAECEMKLAKLDR